MASRARLEKKLGKMEKKCDKVATGKQATAIAKKEKRAKHMFRYGRAKVRAERKKPYSSRMDNAFELEALDREISALKVMYATKTIHRRYKNNVKREIRELTQKRKSVAKKHRIELRGKERRKGISPLIPTALLVLLLAAAFILLK